MSDSSGNPWEDADDLNEVFERAFAEQTPPDPSPAEGSRPSPRDPAGTGADPVGETPVPEPPPLSRAPAPLIRASDLIAPEDRDQGDFEPSSEGMRYKGFEIVSVRDWPENHEALHGNQTRRFYVKSMSGQIGLVPWEGSQVIWPWEQAWHQDLYRPQVESLLKEEPKQKKKT